MKFKLTILFFFYLSVVNAQQIDKKHIYGTWKMEGILLQNEIVPFTSADTLIGKLMANRRKEKPGALITKPDSLGIAIGATSLCEVLNELKVEVNKHGEITFNFTIHIDGGTDYKTETLKFIFKDDTTLTTTDENGKKNDLKILKATANEFSFSGISSARNMQLCFRKEK